MKEIVQILEQILAWWLRTINWKSRIELTFEEKFSLFYIVCFPETNETYMYVGKGYFIPRKEMQTGKHFLSISF